MFNKAVSLQDYTGVGDNANVRVGSVERWWNDTEYGKTEIGLLEAKSLPEPLYPPQIPFGMAWYRIRTSALTEWRKPPEIRQGGIGKDSSARRHDAALFGKAADESEYLPASIYRV
jgi:hypothetical protein